MQALKEWSKPLGLQLLTFGECAGVKTPFSNGGKGKMNFRKDNAWLLPISQLYLANKISRRTFLTWCSAAGITFASPWYLSGCDNSTSKPGNGETDVLSDLSASRASSDQHKFLKEIGRKYEGVKLRLLLEDTPPSTATLEMAKKEFSPITGIELEWVQLPLDKVFAQTIADTSLQTGHHDIFYFDQAWVGRFTNDVVRPSELLSQTDLAYPDYQFGDILPPLVENIASYQGKLVGIPYDIPIFILIYREDLLEKAGLDVPTDLNQYLETVAKLNRSVDRSAYGTSLQWRLGHYSLECNMTAWLWAHGGSIFHADQSPAINDPEAHQAMKYMLELGKYAPPQVTTFDWSDEAAAFRDGQAAMYMSWGEFFPTFDDPQMSKIVGKAQTAQCPKPFALKTKQQCAFDETPGVSHQGGSCIAISKYSKNVEAAWLFMQWATSSDITTRSNLLAGGASPIRASNYDDPRTLERQRVAKGSTRHLPTVREAIENHMGTEPHLPGWADLANNSFAVELGKMVSGQQAIDATLGNMAKATEQAVKIS